MLFLRIMRQTIRYNGVMNMFGYGSPEPNSVRVVFPERLVAARVVNWLGLADLIEDVKLTDIEQCDVPPSNLYEKKPESAVFARIESRYRHGSSIWAEAVAKVLEEKFNPVAQSWQANYAGRLKDKEDSSLYVVTEGGSHHLERFVAINADTLSPLPDDLQNFSFTLRGDDHRRDRIADEMPHKYFDFINKAAETQL